MPNYKGHLIGGIASYLAVIFLCSLGSVPFVKHLSWGIATLAGSLFPDIDVRSTGQRLFLQVLLLLLLLCLFLQAYVPVIIVLVFSFLPLIIPHRGLFHDLSFILMVTGLLALFLISFMPASTEMIASSLFFFLLGVISHLVLDKGVRKTFYR